MNKYYETSDIPESPLVGSGFDFSEKSIRLGFIRKVYSILMCQLLVTLAIVSLLVFEPNCRLYAQTHVEMSFVAIALTFICIIALACCTNVRRKSPINFIMLGIFTFCESFLVGTVASTYDADSVVLAVGVCAVVCFGLTIFAFQTKYDFTACGGFLLVALIVLICMGFLMIVLPNSKPLNIFYASLGAFIFSCYLVLDTQMMVGGQHKYSLSPEEYVFAALNLYLDVINLFLYILQIIGEARN